MIGNVISGDAINGASTNFLSRFCTILQLPSRTLTASVLRRGNSPVPLPSKQFLTDLVSLNLRVSSKTFEVLYDGCIRLHTVLDIESTGNDAIINNDNSKHPS